MQRLLITKFNGQTLCAVCDQMTIRTVRVIEDESILGNIYVGRVENVVNNINAAFIEYAREKKGYYSLTDNEHHIFLNPKNNDRMCIGDLVLVQVSREGVKTKEPTLTGRIGITGRYCALTLDCKSENSSVFISKKITDEDRRSYLKGIVKDAMNNALNAYTASSVNSTPTASDMHFNIIVRTNAEDAPEEPVTAEVSRIVTTMCDILKDAVTRKGLTRMYSPEESCLEDVQNMRATNLEKIITDIPEVYDSVRRYLGENEPGEAAKLEFYDDMQLPLNKLYSVESQISTALNKRVWLPSGGYLVIEPTEALTVIDVNSGKFTGNRKLKDNTYLKINMEAAVEIGRQLMLRNLSGIIVVDFINLNTFEEKKELMSYLADILKADTVPTSVVDMTRLGLVEITRKKIRKPLHEVIASAQL